VREEEDAVATTRAVAAVLLVGILGTARLDATQAGPVDGDTPLVPAIPRVRTDDAVLSGLIQQATDRSPTFQRLLAAIQTTDGVVYVERGRCGHSVRACLMLAITVSGANRILRVLVDGRRTDEQAMAAIAHELRHAMEILGDPSVRTGFGMYQWYSRNGSKQGETFETQAAIDTDHAVYRELKRSLR
jgi:hypothetical protein